MFFYLLVEKKKLLIFNNERKTITFEKKNVLLVRDKQTFDFDISIIEHTDT